VGRERSILEAVVSALKTIDGTGSFTYDLSGDDQVLVGRGSRPARVPAAFVAVEGLDTAQVPGQTPLTRYDRTLTLTVVAFAQASDDKPGSVHAASLDLQDDVMRALEADRSLGGLVYDLEIVSQLYDGAELDARASGLGIVALAVRCRYAETGGA